MDSSHRQHERLDAIFTACISANFPLGPRDGILALELAARRPCRRIEADDQIVTIKPKSAFYKRC